MTIGADENPYQMDGEQRLFHLTKKTVRDLMNAGLSDFLSGRGSFQQMDMTVVRIIRFHRIAKQTPLQMRQFRIVRKSRQTPVYRFQRRGGFSLFQDGIVRI